MDGIVSVNEGLVAWIENSGYRLAGRSREHYHEWDESHPERSVTKLQVAIAS
jgi:effector-binding domain-containing protein